MNFSTRVATLTRIVLFSFAFGSMSTPTNVEEVFLRRSVFVAQNQLVVFSHELKLFKGRDEPWERNFTALVATPNALKARAATVSDDHVSDLDQQSFDVMEDIPIDFQIAPAQDVEPFQHGEEIGRLACRDIDPGNHIVFFVLFVKDDKNTSHVVLDKPDATVGAKNKPFIFRPIITN